MTDAQFVDFRRDTGTYLDRLRGWRPELVHGGAARSSCDLAMASLLDMVDEAAREVETIGSEIMDAAQILLNPDGDNDPERTPLLVPRLPRSAFERD